MSENPRGPLRYATGHVYRLRGVRASLDVHRGLQPQRSHTALCQHAQRDVGWRGTFVVNTNGRSSVPSRRRLGADMNRDAELPRLAPTPPDRQAPSPRANLPLRFKSARRFRSGQRLRFSSPSRELPTPGVQERPRGLQGVEGRGSIQRPNCPHVGRVPAQVERGVFTPGDRPAGGDATSCRLTNRLRYADGPSKPSTILEAPRPGPPRGVAANGTTDPSNQPPIARGPASPRGPSRPRLRRDTRGRACSPGLSARRGRHATAGRTRPRPFGTSGACE